jgi:glycosyltransferase involved in cell wall biosynthesis
VTAIDINGKFLDAKLNGVHRTAALYARELVRRASGSHRVRLLAPKPTAGLAEFPELAPQVAKGWFGAGQGWEMLTLPARARGNLLVNFCNLAPLAHENSVVMIHDAQAFLYPEDYSGRQAFAYRRLLPLIARRARRIITVSDFARRSLVAHGVGEGDKIEVIHNGTEHILNAPEDASILERHGLKRGGFVLTLGSTKSYKNIRCVFEAMARPGRGRMRLVVAGGPDEVNYRRAGWNPPPGTVFTGFVSDAELRALYASAGVFVFPSLTEGFGLPPVEAMHCGAPVIVARAGAMPEVCGDGALLVDAADPGAYREAMDAVLGDRELAARLRARGLRRAGELSWNAAGDRLFELVSRLA